MTKGWRPPADLQLVLTCEHASKLVPSELHELGLRAAVRSSHRGWDPGALPIAEVLAERFGAVLCAGRWSRLVADPNRSADHPRVIARRVDGQPVPGNVALSPAERRHRLATYWQPYRDEVLAYMRRAVRRGPVLHLSVHSFTERLGGVERHNDLGLLHDPARAGERAFCAALRTALRPSGLAVRFNFPYFGDTDGVTTWLRGEFAVRRYLGIELECNQRLSRTPKGQRQLASALSAALQNLLRG